ncbi:MAG: proton-conducting transporter transmembrane domain-containing protein [Bacteroidia bacterium]
MAAVSAVGVVGYAYLTNQLEKRYVFFVSLFGLALAGWAFWEKGIRWLPFMPPWVEMYVFWELTNVASWGLIFWRGGAGHAAAQRAFWISRIGDAALLWGLWRGASEGIVVAACVKAAQLPFSYWLLGAMRAPAIVSALLHSAALVALGVYLPISLRVEFSEGYVRFWEISSFLAGLGALFHPQAKALLAWSTIAHLGKGLSLTPTPDLALTYLQVHGPFKAATFLLIQRSLSRVGYGMLGIAGLSLGFMGAWGTTAYTWLWELPTAMAIGRLLRQAAYPTRSFDKADMPVALLVLGGMYFAWTKGYSSWGMGLLGIAMGVGFFVRFPSLRLERLLAYPWQGMSKFLQGGSLIVKQGDATLNRFVAFLYALFQSMATWVANVEKFAFRRMSVVKDFPMLARRGHRYIEEDFQRGLGWGLILLGGLLWLL